MAQRVLIIDDEWTIQLALKTRLVAHGYAVEFAEDGPSGLAAAKREPPDVILLDLRMPEMDGLEVTQHLKAAPETADIPVIMLTANVQDTVRQQALNAGACDFLTKPYDPKAVLDAIRIATSGVTRAAD